MFSSSPGNSGLPVTTSYSIARCRQRSERGDTWPTAASSGGLQPAVPTVAPSLRGEFTNGGQRWGSKRERKPGWARTTLESLNGSRYYQLDDRVVAPPPGVESGTIRTPLAVMNARDRLPFFLIITVAAQAVGSTRGCRFRVDDSATAMNGAFGPDNRNSRCPGWRTRMRSGCRHAVACTVAVV